MDHAPGRRARRRRVERGGTDDAARPRAHRRARERRPHERAAALLPRRPRARRQEPRRARRDRPIDVLTHPALARLHPTGSHPERRERLAVLLDHQHLWSEGRTATEEELLLVHTPEHVARIRAVAEPGWLD